MFLYSDGGNVQNVKYKKITREMVKNGGDSGAGSILINNVEARTARCAVLVCGNISSVRRAPWFSEADDGGQTG